MRFLFFDRPNTKFGNIIRIWKPILLLPFIFAISRKNQPENKTIQIEFAKPVNGFRATIYWTPKYIKIDPDDEDRKSVVGKATLELERITDKMKCKIDYNLSIDTLVNSDSKKSVYGCFVNHNLPRIIIIKNGGKKKL